MLRWSNASPPATQLTTGSSRGLARAPPRSRVAAPALKQQTTGDASRCSPQHSNDGLVGAAMLRVRAVGQELAQRRVVGRHASKRDVRVCDVRRPAFHAFGDEPALEALFVLVRLWGDGAALARKSTLTSAVATDAMAAFIRSST